MKPKGGARPGAGRKPMSKKLSNYEKACKMLDDNIMDVLTVLLTGLNDPDKIYRQNCARILLNKSIPDRHKSEITGDGGGAIKHIIEIRRAKD